MRPDKFSIKYVQLEKSGNCTLGHPSLWILGWWERINKRDGKEIIEIGKLEVYEEVEAEEWKLMEEKGVKFCWGPCWCRSSKGKVRFSSRFGHMEVFSILINELLQWMVGVSVWLDQFKKGQKGKELVWIIPLRGFCDEKREIRWQLEQNVVSKEKLLKMGDFEEFLYNHRNNFSNEKKNLSQKLNSPS